ncbi:MAG: hypothetical protein EPO06_08680 [Burkholderiaceae bacterium]|nr:MAG: hypothetical protein EPO06_08680 [Burkholderiaceae bacterium]
MLENKEMNRDVTDITDMGKLQYLAGRGNIRASYKLCSLLLKTTQDEMAALGVLIEKQQAIDGQATEPSSVIKPAKVKG